MCVAGGDKAVGDIVEYKCKQWKIKFVAYCTELQAFRLLIVPAEWDGRGKCPAQRTVNARDVVFIGK